jgi:D-alanyl-D-alanine carboxypeptidase
MNEVDSRQRRAARRRLKKRKKKIRMTVFLLFLLILLVGGGGFFIYHMLDNSFETLNESFDVVEEFTDPLISGSHQRASMFAASLCVLDEDVPLASASLESTQAGLLFDLSSKEVLYAQGAFERVYPASITKIMTAMLALKYGNMSDLVTITQENVTLEEGSQVCGFYAGDQLTMEQLLNCLLVYSGNDAASAIAEHIGGTAENFVAMMNDYAAELGCTGTHFTNPHGLQDENHYTTPYDIYLMLKEALNYPDFTAITQQSDYTVTYTRYDGTEMSTYLAATDHYLTGEATAPKNVTVLGGKTGTTSLAGNCLALLCQDAYGKPYCAIVMGAATKDLLYVQMNSLLQNINSII